MLFKHYFFIQKLHVNHKNLIWQHVVALGLLLVMYVSLSSCC